MSRVASGEDLGWAWVSHLRAGGTTPWVEFSASSPPLPDDRAGMTWLPGAQQLELLRRLNLSGRPSPELVTQVLTADLPLRGPLDLDLVGVRENGCDPAEVLDRELVRVAVGILARRAVRLGIPSPRAAGLSAARSARRTRRLWRLARSRPVRLVGDPVLVGGLRRQLRAPSRRPFARTRSRRPVVIVGTSVDRMLLDAWWHRVLQRGAPGWERWQRGVVARDRLPGSVDLAGIARRWGGRGRHLDLRVALDPAAVGRAARSRQLRVPPGPDPVVAELTRLIGAVLGVEVEPEERTRLLRRRVVPALTRSARNHPTEVGADGQHGLLPQARDWAADQQVRLLQRLHRSGYPVTGEVRPVAPAQSKEMDGGRPEALLRLAVTALLDDGLSPRELALGGVT